jgi:hypothetical protein
MQKPALTFLYIIGSFLCINGYAQTAGISNVLSIEAKVSAYESNKIKIAQGKSDLIEIESIWRGKIKKLKDELAALYKERDDLIADMKVGARCSQCKGWKSEFEKKGINFQQHLGEVKGYAVPATTAELEATRQQFSERIAYKKVQIQNLEKGDNEVLKKQAEITNLENANNTICKDMTALSKSHETTVFEEAKSKHTIWTNNLMAYVIKTLIADDIITIYKARISRYQAKLQEEITTTKERVKKENIDEQARKTNNIQTNSLQIKALQQAQATDVAPLTTTLSSLKQEKVQVDAALSKASTTDSLKAILLLSQKQLANQISTTQKSIQDYNTATQLKITALEKNNKMFRDEIFQLNANLPKQQAEALATLKAVYDKKYIELGQLVNNATSDLVNAKKNYVEKVDYYKKLNDAYVALVINESSRIVIAGQKITCPVWNEVRFKVIGNWSQTFSCVNALNTLAKPYSTNIFNAYCAGKSASTYMASYKSFLLGLTANDKEAVRGNSNAAWFDLITQ